MALDKARENVEALRSIAQRVIDPAVAPYYADRTGTLSARAAFASAIAVAKLFQLEIRPSPGKYRLDGAPLDNAGVKIYGTGIYTRETTIYTDKSVVLMLAGPNPMFRPSAGGWGLDGLVFFDLLQTGAGATPDLTRPVLIEGYDGAPLIDWTINECVGINLLDGIRNNPGSIIGGYHFTNNRFYCIRNAFWFREWQPELGVVTGNVFTPGHFEYASITTNLAMLAKWSEVNGRGVACDMTDAIYGDTIDGWSSSGNMWFGAWWAQLVSGGFNVSQANDIFDNVDRILSITGSGKCPSLDITMGSGYSIQNRSRRTRTRAFEFTTTGVYNVTIDGRLNHSQGDGVVDDGSGRGVVTLKCDAGTLGGAGQEASGAATVTIGSPAVWTKAGHGFPADRPVRLSTTGALPTGFTAGTVYYVRNPTTDTFNLAATPGGGTISSSGTQSGVHTVTDAEATYFLRVSNPLATYNVRCPIVNNFGGHSEVVGISVVDAKQVNVIGTAFEGMRTTVAVENTMTGVVNLVGCNDDSLVAGAKSLSVGATAIANGVVKARANNWKFAYDVDDGPGSI